MKIKKSPALLLLLAAAVLFSACTAPWERNRKADEPLTPPETNTVARAGDAQPEEPESLEEYQKYASVRIAASASIRLYVDEKQGTATVVGIQALNHKASRLTEDLDLAGEPYGDAVEAIAERNVQKGFANDLNARVVIEVEQEPRVGGQTDLKKTAEDAFSAVYSDHGLEAVFGNEEEAVGE